MRIEASQSQLITKNNIRFFQPISNHLENIGFSFFCVVESWGIDKNNITGDSIRERKPDGANVTCTWFQTMSDSYVGIFRDCIDELDRWWVRDTRLTYNVKVRTVLFPEPLGPITLEIQCDYPTSSQPRSGNSSRDDHIIWRQFFRLVSFHGSQRTAGCQFV